MAKIGRVDSDAGRFVNINRFVENMRLNEVQTTSDFGFMADLIDRGMKAGAADRLIPTSYDKIGYRRDTKSFESAKDYELNRAKLVEKVLEKAPYLPKEPEESYYEYKTYKYGEQYDISWEAWLRDGRDLGILQQMYGKSQAWIQSAEYTKEYEFTSIWAGNDTFFTAPRGNLLNLSLSAANLSTAIEALKSQTDPAGNVSFLGGQMFLVVPPELEYTARGIVNSASLITGENATIGEANPVYNAAQLIVNPFLPTFEDNGETDTWYLFADPRLVPAVRYGYVIGEEAPQITVRDSDARMLMGGSEVDPFDGSFESDDIEFRLRFTFGADLMDYRGAVRSTP